METSKEIRSVVNNIRFYTKKIQELTELQFKKDFETGRLFGINTGAESVRFESTGAIHTAAGWISIYCDNIEANLANAETQDKKLIVPEEVFNES